MQNGKIHAQRRRKQWDFWDFLVLPQSTHQDFETLFSFHGISWVSCIQFCCMRDKICCGFHLKKKKGILRVRLRGECQPWLKFQPCFEDCVTLKVALTPQIFVTEINFRCCPDYFGEKVFSSGFFVRMLYLLKGWKLGAFLAHGRQYFFL